MADLTEDSINKLTLIDEPENASLGAFAQTIHKAEKGQTFYPAKIGDQSIGNASAIPGGWSNTNDVDISNLLSSDNDLSMLEVLNRNKKHDVQKELTEAQSQSQSQSQKDSRVSKNRKVSLSYDTLKENPDLSTAINDKNEVLPSIGAHVLFSDRKTYVEDKTDLKTNSKSKFITYSKDLTEDTPRSEFARSSNIMDDDDDDGSDLDSPSKRTDSHQSNLTLQKGNDSKFQSNHSYKDRLKSKVFSKLSNSSKSQSRRVSDEKFANTSQEFDKMPLYKRVFLDPQIPLIFSLYIQLLVNLALITIILYFLSMFILTIRADINNKINSQLLEITQEIAVCAREYSRNNCQPEFRVPALEVSCMAWERCMKRDPKSVGKAKIGAETFAEIINGFIRPISWKTIFFITFGIFGSLLANNFVFDSYRTQNNLIYAGDMASDKFDYNNTTVINNDNNNNNNDNNNVTPYKNYQAQKLLASSGKKGSFLESSKIEDYSNSPFKSAIFNTSLNIAKSSPLKFGSFGQNFSPVMDSKRRRRVNN